MVVNTGAAGDMRRELRDICDGDLVFGVPECPRIRRVLPNFAGPEPRLGRTGPGCPGAPGIAQCRRPMMAVAMVWQAPAGCYIESGMVFRCEASAVGRMPRDEEIWL